ncbi:tetratricopeptide repeat protein [Pontibacterium sp.]|uniref:tetratricopeptide repeat protein n=1 Tax=Pontibacterium sp. TaxID=2036026 RepID=UPI0035669D76
MKGILVLLLGVILTGCALAPHDQGMSHYSSGKYDHAAHQWNISNDHYLSQYGLGLLWHHGLGSTAKNTDQASQWYIKAARQGYPPAMNNLAIIQMKKGYTEAAQSWLTLAARWGNQTAIKNLRIYNLPVPKPDLYARQQAAQSSKKAEQARSDAVNAMLLNSFMQGYLGGAPSYQPAMTGRSSPAVKPSACTSDSQCGYGNACVKPMGSVYGSCAAKVDEYGRRTLSSPRSGVEVRTFGSEKCSFSFECPDKFKCDQSLKMCVMK